MFKVCGVFKVYEQENNGISTEVEAIFLKKSINLISNFNEIYSYLKSTSIEN